jgi:glycerate dehydrogenase
VVDTEAAGTRGIPVTNIPAYGTDAVGQFAIALLLEICHHIGHHDAAVKEGRWEKNADWCFWDYPLIELAGKTMGIIGFGRIGQTTGKIAGALGMEVIAYDENTSDSGRKIAAYVSREELFARSDVIALHCPLFPATEGMINRNTIANMKDGVIILNNSRGPLIVEQDLADALNSGKVYAAGLDVVSTEPVNGDNPLLKAKNCIITPHISWASKESRQRLMDIAVNNLEAFIKGKAVNVVND